MLSRVGVEGEHQLHLLYLSHCKQQRLVGYASAPQSHRIYVL